eukprot:3491890-Rhodomonas_salina.1
MFCLTRYPGTRYPGMLVSDAFGNCQYTKSSQFASYQLVCAALLVVGPPRAFSSGSIPGS